MHSSHGLIEGVGIGVVYAVALDLPSVFCVDAVTRMIPVPKENRRKRIKNMGFV